MKAIKIPEKSRSAVQNRSLGHCEMCGGPNPSHWHHRRSRSVRDEVTHSPANGVYLDSICHAWVHANPKKAMERGFIVSRYDNPTEISFKRWDGRWILPDTEGGFSILSDPTPIVVNAYEQEEEEQP